MKHFAKLLYLVLYLLFLCSVFILFAVIQNSFVKSLLSYLSLFVALVTGSLLYLLAMRKQGPTALQSTDQNQIVTDETIEANTAQSSEETSEDQEIQIDIQKLLPSRTLGIEKYTEELLQNMADPFNIVQGLVYLKNPNEDMFHCYGQYAYFSENKPAEFRTGESLPGQAVKNKIIVTLSDIPDKFMTIASGLGKSNPRHLIFVPLKNQDDVVGLIEYATFEPLTDKQHKALEGVSKRVADTIIKHFKK
jgi:hypothetical protein